MLRKSSLKELSKEIDNKEPTKIVSKMNKSTLDKIVVKIKIVGFVFIDTSIYI